MKEPSALTLEHVAVGYGRHVILPDVDLSLPRGSFTGLLGANGSGKSTLLKTVLGILAGRTIKMPEESTRKVIPVCTATEE